MVPFNYYVIPGISTRFYSHLSHRKTGNVCLPVRRNSFSWLFSGALHKRERWVTGILLTLLFSAAASYAQDSVQLSGRIKNPQPGVLRISYNSNRIAYDPAEYYAPLDKNGKFSIKFPVPQGVYTEAGITYGTQYVELILHSGDSLVLSADGSRFDSTVMFAGRGAAIQNFIMRHSLVLNGMNWYAVKLKEAINKDPADFLNTIAAHKKAEQDFVEKNKEALPASFIKFWNAWHQYYNYFIIQQYPRIHEVIRLRRFTDTIPEVNNSVVQHMPLTFDDDLIQVTPYLLYLTGAFDIKLRAGGFGYLRGDTANERRLEDSIYSLVYTSMPDRSAEYFVAQDIYGRARTQDLEITKRRYEGFIKRWPHSAYLPLVDRQVAIAKRLAPGMPAPDMDLLTAGGDKVKLSDLKGKVVYITFWASWCKQCVSELITWQKNRALFKKQPVEFVYVSLDRDTNAARAIFSKYQVDGISSVVTGEWEANEVQQYGVQSLPAYYLIDKNGNIAVQNVRTPAQPTELVLQIGSLLTP